MVSPYVKMKQMESQSMLNSVRIQDDRENLYQDSSKKNGLYKIKVPKTWQKYNKFDIKQVRKEVEQSNAYSENLVNRMPSKLTKSPTIANSNSDYNSDYLLDDHSVFKITFDKDSTTVTDMGNSGFSFTEVKKSYDRKSGRSMSFDEQRKRETLQNILPVINQYRRMMRSPGSISEHHMRGGIPIIL